MTTSNPSTPATTRSTYWALWGGIAFSLLFTLLIVWLDPFLDRFIIPPDQGPTSYEWQLADPTVWSQVTAWGFYAIHQVIVWGLIYYAQTRVKHYTTGLHRINVLALTVNAAFIFFHLIQTHIWYDGLAQDVDSWTSQNSVILLLVWVLLMENSRRGLFFGKKVPIPQRITQFARKYHGYVFAWGIIYTFWFHPMVSTPGHLLGFFYMFLLMLQSSLFFTRVHINKWWTIVQEVTVFFHGSIVAYYQGLDIWPMFAFGFAGMFVITQMYGLGLSRWLKLGVIAVYIGFVAWFYTDRGLGKLNEIIRIPVVEYLSVLALVLVIGGGLWLATKFKQSKGKSQQPPDPTPTPSVQSTDESFSH